MAGNKKNADSYRKLALVFIVITSVVCVSFFIFAVLRMQRVFYDQMYVTALETRKSYLYDTVNNLIREIDIARHEKTDSYQTVSENISPIVKQYAERYVEATGNTAADGFASYFDDVSEYDCWSYLVYNSETGEVYYDVGHLAGSVYNGGTDKKLLAAQCNVTVGDTTCVYGVSEAYITALVQNETQLKIKNLQFDDGEYMWMEKIRNVDGGDGFAVMLVHPSLPEMEGMLLSTEEKDETGTRFRKDMLDGLNRDGEVFTTYFYREYQSDLISKKISYAKLYPDYGWVICIGIPVHYIMEDVKQVEAANKSTVIKLTIVTTILFVTVFGLCLYFLIKNDRQFYKIRELDLRKEVEIDELTKANTRKYGNKLMQAKFNEFKATGDSPAIMLLDVDKFKTVNDTYGHDAGDEVLKKVVRIMQKNMRTRDRLIRWGGDEFVGIFDGISREALDELAKKLVTAVSGMQIHAADQEINVTVSLGFTFFHMEDKDYTDAVKRADEGLYQSKTGGRNRFNIAE
ncbi:MAG: diguanylate cyclase [Lachnospiraceae bacterium]|nr:diguanylate cyclase [Lachnospiraceae bacterium]